MKVILILTDGMRPDSAENHPVIRHFIKNGTYCMDAQTTYPQSATLQCHMSLFKSLDASRHGLVDADEDTYIPQDTPVTGLFELLAGKEKKCAMLYSWRPLSHVTDTAALHSEWFASAYWLGHPHIAREEVEATKRILRDGQLDFIFLYLGWPDNVGHRQGWMSQPYLDAVAGCCDMVGELIEEFGDEYTFIYTADHGGHEKTHGSDMPEDMTIPIFFLGNSFAAGKQLHGLSIKDIAPTVAKLFEIETPNTWEGKSIL